MRSITRLLPFVLAILSLLSVPKNAESQALSNIYVSNGDADWGRSQQAFNETQQLYVYLEFQTANHSGFQFGASCVFSLASTYQQLHQVPINTMYVQPGSGSIRSNGFWMQFPNAAVDLTCVPNNHPDGAVSVVLNPSLWNNSGGQASAPVNPSQPSQPVPTPVVVAPAPVTPQPVEPAGPEAMDAGSFSSLLASVNAQSFSDDQLAVIRTAVTTGNHFTVAQVGQIIGVLSFGDDKIEAVVATWPSIVDQQNIHTIFGQFTFSSDVEELRRRLGI